MSETTNRPPFMISTDDHVRKHLRRNDLPVPVPWEKMVRRTSEEVSQSLLDFDVPSRSMPFQQSAKLGRHVSNKNSFKSTHFLTQF